MQRGRPIFPKSQNPTVPAPASSKNVLTITFPETPIIVSMPPRILPTAMLIVILGRRYALFDFAIPTANVATTAAVAILLKNADSSMESSSRRITICFSDTACQSRQFPINAEAPDFKSEPLMINIKMTRSVELFTRLTNSSDTDTIPER